VIKLTDEARLEFVCTGMPAELWPEIVAYAERCEPPGDFLRAVLEWDGMARHMPWGGTQTPAKTSCAITCRLRAGVARSL
jgi:hypothetical protein